MVNYSLEKRSAGAKDIDTRTPYGETFLINWRTLWENGAAEDAVTFATFIYRAKFRKRDAGLVVT